MAGANNGKPKPANERRKITAARADNETLVSTAAYAIHKSTIPEAACSVNESITYAWRLWYVEIIPTPTSVIPCGSHLTVC